MTLLNFEIFLSLVKNAEDLRAIWLREKAFVQKSDDIDPVIFAQNMKGVYNIIK